jgi:hypothetical protein
MEYLASTAISLVCPYLKEDSALAEDIRQMLNGFGPIVQVVQNIEVAEGVTGAKIGELVSGSVQVKQDIKYGQGYHRFQRGPHGPVTCLCVGVRIPTIAAGDSD